jgi:phosphate transport system permease protein
MQDATAKIPPGRDAADSSLLPDARHRARLRRWRNFKDGFSRYGVAIGGGGVVVALALMFVYLLSEVVPLFAGAEVEPRREMRVADMVGAGADAVGYVAIERYEEAGLLYARDGRILQLDLTDGSATPHAQIPLAEGVAITSFGAGEPRSNLVAYGLSDGTALVVAHDFTLGFEGDARRISSELEYPLGDQPLIIDAAGQPLKRITVQSGGTGYVVVAETPDRQLHLRIFEAQSNFLTGEVEVSSGEDVVIPAPAGEIAHVLVDNRLRSLYVFGTDGMAHYFDISQRAAPPLVQSVRVVPRGEQVTAAAFLIGTVSVIVGGSDGSVTQWFPVRDAENRHRLTRIRDFVAHKAAVTVISPEHSRKGFVTGDAAGNIAIHFATSDTTVLQESYSDAPIRQIAISPPGRAMLVLDAAGKTGFLGVRNEHPDISWSALWGKVWYEGRAAPEYIWQSSSASDEFEPKYSMMPLSLGTLKAAFYAMLFAMPLAIMGAIYTAYFMSPKLRGTVKPTIEVMEALPTVILGFLAGLWLAPFMENNLPAVFSILLLMPVAFLAAAALWPLMPAALRHRYPAGWEAVLLLPVIFLVGWACVLASPWLEIWFFEGSMRQWLTDVGITYDQRNAMVVGIAMGFAVIPTIYSIAEDAVFSVPKHLTQGSLALGATPWQTVTGVVLLTASPGIFSAVMIGFGRAIGETMIVLMATGNSPVMNFNLFEGMRTLSANIAVELPETAVHSSHFRILFLAALVLFVFTFIINTLAEMVRQRLRRRYASM